MTMLATILGLALTASATMGTQLQLPELAKRSPIIVVARVATPRTEVQNLPSPSKDPGARTFLRARRRYELVRAVRGQVAKAFVVDEPQWAAQYAEWKKCQAGKACQPPKVDFYRGKWGREPNSGEEVLLFLRKNGQGQLELTADFAIDHPVNEAQVRLALEPSQKAR